MLGGGARNAGVRLLAACALLGGCAGAQREQAAVASRDGNGAQMLFAATTTIQDRWEELPIKGITEYRLAVADARLGIRARGTGGASGLVRYVDIDSNRCPGIEWSWRVDRLQPSADLRTRAHEDVAASIFLFFGDPGLFSMPERVPTLRYVWTNDLIPVGAVVDNPYLPSVVRSIVVRSGTTATGQWVFEKRNLRADFVAAFGTEPPAPVAALALFTDNDQTKEPVEAHYAWGRSLCASRNTELGMGRTDNDEE